MRTFDPRFLNKVANHPDVRPWLGGEGIVDLTDKLANADNYAFVCEQGGFVVENIFENRFECHSIFLPEREGAGVITKLMFSSQQFMFINTNCEELVTKVPEDNAAALGLARAGRFTAQFKREGVWPPDKKAVSYLTLPLDRWARLCSATREAGQLFHNALEAAEDELHDQIVGATVLMIQAGNVVKGVRFHNRWATFAGYPLAQIISIQPPVISIGGKIFGFNSGKVEVLPCP